MVGFLLSELHTLKQVTRALLINKCDVVLLRSNHCIEFHHLAEK